MVAVTLHLVIDGIDLCINACGDSSLVVCAIQAIHHRTTFSLTSCHQLLGLTAIDQRLWLWISDDYCHEGCDSECFLHATLIVADTRHGEGRLADIHIVGICDAIVRACRQRSAVQRHADSWSQGLARIWLCGNVAKYCPLNATRCDGCRSCCLLSALSQLVVGDTRTTQCQLTDIDSLFCSCISIRKLTNSRYSQIITTDDAAIHYLVITQRCCCRTVVFLVLCCDTTDGDSCFIDG